MNRKKLPNVEQKNAIFPRTRQGQINYAVRNANFVRTYLRPELKRYEEVATNATSSTATIIHITSVVGGPDEDDRIGNRIFAKYVTMNLSATINASATATICRILLVVDTDNTGTDPTAALILETANNVLSPINSDYTQRFTTLIDRIVNLSINGQNNWVDKVYKRCNFMINYTGPAGTETAKNNIYLLLLSNEATNTPTIGYYFRLAFTDLG